MSNTTYSPTQNTFAYDSGRRFDAKPFPPRRQPRPYRTGAELGEPPGYPTVEQWLANPAEAGATQAPEPGRCGHDFLLADEAPEERHDRFAVQPTEEEDAIVASHSFARVDGRMACLGCGVRELFASWATCEERGGRCVIGTDCPGVQGIDGSESERLKYPCACCPVGE